MKSAVLMTVALSLIAAISFLPVRAQESTPQEAPLPEGDSGRIVANVTRVNMLFTVTDKKALRHRFDSGRF